MIRSGKRRGLTENILSGTIEALVKNQDVSPLVAELYDSMDMRQNFYVDYITSITIIQPETVLLKNKFNLI